MLEGAACDTEDRDALATREVLLDACAGGCSPTAISFTVNNDDEGGDRISVNLEATIDA
jgi:hypothetical protein